MAIDMEKFQQAGFRSLAGLSINFSAAWFAVPFIGATFAFPNTEQEIFALIKSMFVGIIFLTLSVVFERKLIT